MSRARLGFRQHAILTTPDQLAQLLVTGLTIGSIYALVGLGFVAVYNVTGIINFAQGEFVMLGALGVVSLERVGLPLAAAALGSVGAVSLVGAALHALAIRPARRASVITLIIVTLGGGVAPRGAALLRWGTDPTRWRPSRQARRWRLGTWSSPARACGCSASP